MGAFEAARETWFGHQNRYAAFMATYDDDIDKIPADKRDEAMGLAEAVNTSRAKAMRLRAEPAATTTRTLPFPLRGGAAGSGYPATRMALSEQGWGQAVVDSMEMRSAGGGNAIYASALTGGTIAVGVPLNVTPIPIAHRARFLRELIPTDTALGGRFAFMRQTVRTNNAAAVAVGALKPTSVYTMQRVDDRTRTIAHLSEPIPRQDLADASLIRSFIDSELAYGLDLALDGQILSGSGTAEDMTGILTTSGIQTQAFATDALQTSRKALTKLQAVDLDGSAWVMNPASWEKVELLAQAQFASNPGQSTPTGLMERSLWGIPVLVSNAVAADVAVLGDFRGSSVLYVTESTTIDWSEQTYDPDALGAGVGASDFQRNLVRFRAESRACIAVTRPLGFVSVALA